MRCVDGGRCKHANYDQNLSIVSAAQNSINVHKL